MKGEMVLGGSYVDTYDREFGWGENEFRMAREVSEDLKQGIQRYQTFWQSPGSRTSMDTWSKMVRQGDKINYQYHNYDADENIGYDYCGTFSVDDYRVAIEQVMNGGSSEIHGERCILSICNDGERVSLTFRGNSSPCTSTGGEELTSSLQSTHKLEELLLLE